MSGSDVSILIPVLRRPWRIPLVYESALAATSDANILFIASPDDRASLDVLEAFALDHAVTDWPGGTRGDYARKINLGLHATTTPYLFTGADDLDFHPGWYETALGCMTDVVCVVGTNDLCNARTISGAHSTHSLVRRSYAVDGGAVFDLPNAIYSPLYFHEYCDDELCGRAMAVGCYVHCFDAIVEHLHPNAGKADDDETYRLGRERSRLSRRVFLYRRRRWTV